MRGPLISEKEFELAFDYEFINKIGATNLFEIYMPNSIKEKDEGFDSKFKFNSHTIVTSIFFQFKIPKIYFRSETPCFDPLHNSPYTKFRYEINKKEKYGDYHLQHKLLRKLSSNGENVFYVSPTVIDRNSLLEQLKSKTVISTSKAFNLNQFPDLHPADSSKHIVYYTAPENVGYFCSDPRLIKTTDLNEFIFMEDKNAQEKSIKEPSFNSYFSTLLDKINKSFSNEPMPRTFDLKNEWNDMSPLQKILAIVENTEIDLSLALIMKKKTFTDSFFDLISMDL